MEIIRFKITIYLVIKQNIFEFSSESRVYKNEHSPEKKPSVFPGLWRQNHTSKHSKTLDASMEESHLRKPPFEHGIKSL